jgi:hypothetical protein
VIPDHPYPSEAPVALCVPKTSSTSCDHLLMSGIELDGAYDAA